MTVPLVLGFYLGDARQILKKAGATIGTIKVTAPPRYISNEFDDTYRIIWQDSKNLNSIELIVCKPL